LDPERARERERAFERDRERCVVVAA